MADSDSSIQTSPPDSATMPAAAAVPPKVPIKGRTLNPSFRVLIGLTLLTSIFLTPFAFSAHYLDWLRDLSFELHPLLRGELYKQATGAVSLVFVLLEMVLTVRKRGRKWPIKLNLPGRVPMWRSIHIFVGVGLVAIVLVHTLGSTGFNFNAIFLWIFFGVTLTALVGVVAEAGILESGIRQFGTIPLINKPLMKGPLVKNIRNVWLLSHIFLVSIFLIMLVMHILLAYYYQ